MSISEKRSWLVAYDVADPRRLGRVHRYLKRCAIPVQYSVFVTRCDGRQLQRILGCIEEHIDRKEDDVRAYHLPDRCEVAVLGAQHLPDGILLPVKGLGRLLDALTDTDTPVMVSDYWELNEEVE
jgi:CRISPR-associated protein Cas2